MRSTFALTTQVLSSNAFQKRRQVHSLLIVQRQPPGREKEDRRHSAARLRNDRASRLAVL